MAERSVSVVKRRRESILALQAQLKGGWRLVRGIPDTGVG